MSFNSREFSLASGRPVRLYQFSRGVLHWSYNSSDRDVAHQNQIFRALRGGISDDGIRQGGGDNVRNLRILAPADLEVAQFYRGIPPSDAIDLVIYDRHVGEEEFRVSWVGEIQSVAWPAVDRCQIVCNPETVSMGQQGLRLCWERPCPHALYEHNCRANRDDFRVDGTITSMDGAMIHSAAFATKPAGWFSAGYLEWSLGANVWERRAIEGNLGTGLLVFGGTSGLELDMQVRAYAGCDQLLQTCSDKFHNHLNYGGIFHLPRRSPFDGNPIF
ncbi:phage BR0599 family protein [Pseudomonas alcaligenes]|uniref:phage BR0599 family protein n=1 Tax=Aquipseudomonas alcaligenes TaxID=43263 RepID=UPI00358EC977